MKWNEFCHSCLKTKCCEEKYEVVFKAGDDLHGLRTEGCTLFHHLHLDTSKVIFGEVKEQIINSSFFASHLALGLSEMIFGHSLGTPWHYQGSIPLIAQVQLGATDLD